MYHKLEFFVVAKVVQEIACPSFRVAYSNVSDCLFTFSHHYQLAGSCENKPVDSDERLLYSQAVFLFLVAKIVIKVFHHSMA